MSVITPDQLPEGKYWRLTNKKECPRGFQYKDGLNVDTQPFNPTGSCKPGGLYFFSDAQLANYQLYVKDPVWIRQVTFPPDAQIYVEKGKYKADKFILSERSLFSFRNPKAFLQITQTPENCLQAVLANPTLIKYVKEQTIELCLTAIQKNPFVIEHIREQTPELCMAAVQRSGWALRYVQNQTREICMVAVQRCQSSLKYVNNQTEEICIAAIQKYPWDLQYVKVQTPEIWRIFQEHFHIFFFKNYLKHFL